MLLKGFRQTWRECGNHKVNPVLPPAGLPGNQTVFSRCIRHIMSKKKTINIYYEYMYNITKLIKKGFKKLELLNSELHIIQLYLHLINLIYTSILYVHTRNVNKIMELKR